MILCCEEKEGAVLGDRGVVTVNVKMEDDVPDVVSAP